MHVPSKSSQFKNLFLNQQRFQKTKKGKNVIYIPRKYFIKTPKVVVLTEREMEIEAKKKPKKGELPYIPPMTEEMLAENFAQKSNALFKKYPKFKKQYIFDLIRFRTKRLIQKK